MSVRNGECHVAETVDSVIDQSFTDWEMVVVDDGSTDKTAAILANYDDPRIRVVTRDHGSGLPAALNAGLAHCRAALVARIDADDRCAPDRLEVQIGELARRPDVAVLGSSARLIDDSGNAVGVRIASADPARVLHRLRWRSALIHPSVMFRKDIIESVGAYDEVAGGYEDFELWLRVAAVSRLANLDRPLIDYRVHPGQVTAGRMFNRRGARSVGRSRLDLARRRGESVPSAALRHSCWVAGQIWREWKLT
jgi:glycosyltransferase involved in cell wall biosynthesis